MKYGLFLSQLERLVARWALVESPIVIKLGTRCRITLRKRHVDWTSHRFVVFPVKIYGLCVRHMNVLVWDMGHQRVERFEPFRMGFPEVQPTIDGALTNLLNQLAAADGSQTLQYRTLVTAWGNKSDHVDTHCCRWCLEWLEKKFPPPVEVGKNQGEKKQINK
ncbi:hypothetical protein MIV082L [Invertebrate iridescent virus 3]|uniref:Uncharacterized protein 082L n=1 Tax=Invertebrate iridescent virus 3 TaxID=345201 RepID=082L_IIV3|nr:hypothetical protein MIV082L [Invertebrate iridescent virus 3]Q196X8.1 RecName: Full=Uncharacterized protein 082L [Invertebrate iridescent virus 3]ABF82112.1 hypothetical protein MIV082L [Invertebrate iridescent virus 3]